MFHHLQVPEFKQMRCYATSAQTHDRYHGVLESLWRTMNEKAKFIYNGEYAPRSNVEAVTDWIQTLDAIIDSSDILRM